MSDKPTLPDFDHFIKTGERQLTKKAVASEPEPETEEMIEGDERMKLSEALQLVLGSWQIIRTDIVAQSQVKESAIDRARYDKHVPFIKKQAESIANALGLTLEELLELAEKRLKQKRLLVLKDKVDEEIRLGRIRKSNRRRPFVSQKKSK